jgi:tight adherence protein C
VVTFLSLLIFGAVVLTVVGCAPSVADFGGAVRRAYRTERIQSEGVHSLLHGVYPLIHVIAQYNRGPRWQKHKRRLEELLRHAGGPIEIQGAELMAIRQLSAVACFVGGVLVFVGVLGMPLLLSVLVGLGGYALPIVWLRSYVQDRLTALHRELPYMIDLVVMAMEAGSLFREAVENYIRDNADEALAGEWRLFLAEMQLGKTRREAFTNLAERAGSDDIRSLAVTVTQGEEMGTPLGTLLRMYADGLRLKRTQRAEKLAGEAAVRILAPTMLMMMAVMLMILGPVLVRYVRGGLLV